MSTEEEFISFAPSDISRSIFSRLLKCYPTAIKEVHRDKLNIKHRPKKPKKGDSTPSTAKASESQVEKELDVFLKLDEWRYEELPGKMKERAQVDGEEGKEIYLDKEEAVQLMDWKLKHGVFRPALLGMVKSNQGPLVKKSTTAAFAALPTVDPVKEPNAAFPQASLDALTGPLRGVGPATASLILCAGTCLSDSGIQVPFFSDEIYQWLCLDYYPSAEKPQGDDNDDEDEEKKKAPPKKGNGELIIKYNLREYRTLWNAVLEIRDRLNKKANPDSADENKKRIFSVVDVEKVAFVLANIDLSGYFGEPTKPRPSLHEVLPPKIKQPKPKGEEVKESKTEAKKRKRKEEEKANKALKRRGRN